MKKEELMIGDWVYNTHNSQYEKVYEIGSGLVMLDYNDLYEYDEIEPIPLKRIHLTKNGFKVTDAEDTTFVLRDGYKVEVTFDRGIEEMDIPPTIYLSIKFADAEYWKTISYVHQLQQAMRMFDIEKEISL